MYASLGAAPSPAATQAIALIQAAPCWSQSLQDCVEGRASSAANCAAIRAGYATPADVAAVDPVIDKKVFCPEPTSWAMYVGVGAIAFAFGALVGSAFGK